MAEEKESSLSVNSDAFAQAFLGTAPKDEYGQTKPFEALVNPTPQTTTTNTEAPIAETPTVVEPELETPASTEQAEVVQEDGTPLDSPIELPELDELDVVGLLQEADIQVGSLEEIKEALALKSKYNETQSEFAGLTEDEKRRVAIGREFGDPNLYDRVKSLNTDLLPEKEILRQVFFLKNHGKSPEFLSMKFDRDFSAKYQLAEKDITSAEDATEEQEIKFTKLSLADDAAEARELLKNFQDVLATKTIGSTTPLAPEDDTEFQENWAKGVDTVLEKTDRVSYNVDGTSVSIVMDPENREIVESFMRNPIQSIIDMVTDDSGNIDPEALFELAMRNVNFSKILGEVKKVGGATFHESQLKANKNIVTPAASGKLEVPKQTAQDQFANYVLNR